MPVALTPAGTPNRQEAPPYAVRADEAHTPNSPAAVIIACRNGGAGPPEGEGGTRQAGQGGTG